MPKLQNKKVRPKTESEIHEHYECLLIEFDDKKLFTHKKNLYLLIHFSKRFKAKISLVKVEKAQILEMADIAQNFCEKSCSGNKVEYQTISQKFSIDSKKKVKKQKNITTNSRNLIKQYIKSELLAGNSISVIKVHKVFSPDYKIAISTCRKYIKDIQKDLYRDGVKTIRTSPGVYEIEQLQNTIPHKDINVKKK